jgi:hypothetical protein
MDGATLSTGRSQSSIQTVSSTPRAHKAQCRMRPDRHIELAYQGKDGTSEKLFGMHTSTGVASLSVRHVCRQPRQALRGPNLDSCRRAIYETIRHGPLSKRGNGHHVGGESRDIVLEHHVVRLAAIAQVQWRDVHYIGSQHGYGRIVHTTTVAAVLFHELMHRLYAVPHFDNIDCGGQKIECWVLPWHIKRLVGFDRFQESLVFGAKLVFCVTCLCHL